MLQLKVYRTVNAYLAENQAVLEERELENNIILGICNSFPDKNIQMPDCHFISVFDGTEFKATSVRTLPKAIVSGTTKNSEDIKLLAGYFNENKINIKGVVGETVYAEAFTNYSNKKAIRKRELLVHKLDKVNDTILSEGEFKVAKLGAVEYLSEWSNQFQHDAHAFPKKTKTEIHSFIKGLIANGDLFTWVKNGDLMSMAGIVRKTKNLGIVGQVYTPKHLRGKGYAKSCVLKLSEHILNSSYKNCGLFTETANPTSNKIYKEVGYNVSTQFSDIAFD
ncbi:MAG: GNAT family N-acetyltransferase [Bacteroidetes bacterium]|nr:GNAT family N-acetyltransferase [Bacteroidota bacterium]